MGVMTPKTTAVAYLRVSTDEQANHGVSLDVQRSKVEAYAMLFDIDLVAVEVDAGVSAKSLKRPGLERALLMLQTRKASALLVAKLDRLTRSVRDLCTLVERHFEKRSALLSVGEQIDTRTASGRMVVQMLTVIAEWERGTIGERTAAAKQHLRSRGRYLGGDAPYGFALAPDGELVEVAAEQAVIVEARRLRNAGHSFRAVAATLHELGHRSRTGRTLGPSHVHRMVASDSRWDSARHGKDRRCA